MAGAAGPPGRQQRQRMVAQGIRQAGGLGRQAVLMAPLAQHNLSRGHAAAGGLLHLIHGRKALPPLAAYRLSVALRMRWARSAVTEVDVMMLVVVRSCQSDGDDEGWLLCAGVREDEEAILTNGIECGIDLNPTKLCGAAGDRPVPRLGPVLGRVGGDVRQPPI